MGSILDHHQHQSPPTQPPAQLPLTRASVQQAHAAIRHYVHRTPVYTNTTISALASTPQTSEALRGTKWQQDHGDDSNQAVAAASAAPKIRFFFKCENLQRIGAFKARGAFHAISRVPEDVRRKGIVTHSSGNHAQATALACKTFGIQAHVIMPEISTSSKIAGTKSLGANVYFSGSTAEERELVTNKVLASLEPGAIVLPPYNHPDIILGQGTLALELEQQVEELGARLDAVIGPCGGGGMLSGVATALHGTGIKVFGAEPSFQGANDAERGLAQGERVTSVKTLTIADGLRTPLGDITWSIISDPSKVAGVYSVTEDQIKAAMKLLLERAKIFVEPSACVGLAVALFNEDFRRRVERESAGREWNIGIVLTGGNTTVEAIAKLFAT